MKHDDVLSMYLKEINKIPLLTREEEVELCEKARKGDKAAKDKIINANLRFVVKVAKKYQNHGLDLTDLISEGNIGLITAIDKFDASNAIAAESLTQEQLQDIVTKINEVSKGTFLESYAEMLTYSLNPEPNYYYDIDYSGLDY